MDGTVFIEFDAIFLELIEIDPKNPQYKVQLTPTSLDVKGPLVVQKSDRGFMVVDAGEKTNATFDWEVAALKKIEDEAVKYPTKTQFEKKFDLQEPR